MICLESSSQMDDVSELYKKEKLVEPLVLNNVIVIYKDNEKAIIKRQNDRAIYIYQNAQDLKLGYSYDLQINQIFDYYGLKEIKDFTVLDKLEEVRNYENLYLDANSIDILDFKYENEVITNLKGEMKNSKLYLDKTKYIKIYSKNKKLMPKDGEKITILNAQLASYRGNMQIIIHKQSDFKVGF